MSVARTNTVQIEKAEVVVKYKNKNVDQYTNYFGMNWSS